MLVPLGKEAVDASVGTKVLMMDYEGVRIDSAIRENVYSISHLPEIAAYSTTCMQLSLSCSSGRLTEAEHTESVLK
jgi:hypothetical protein